MKKRLQMICALAVLAGLVSPLAAQQATTPPLFQLTNVDGACDILRPAAANTEAAVNRKAYPFGTTITTGVDGKAMVLLTADPDISSASAMMAALSEVKVERNPDALTNALIRVARGAVEIFAETDTPQYALVIEAADYSIRGFTGRATLNVAESPEFHTSTVEVTKGGVVIEGDQFLFADMRVGCNFVIETTADRSLTRISGVKGETVITLQNGTDEPLAFAARPGSIVKIWRRFAPVGGRQIIAVFAVGPDGKHPECYAYAVGQPGMVSVETIAEAAPEAGAGEAAAGAGAFDAGATPAAGGMSAEEVDNAFKEFFGDAF